MALYIKAIQGALGVFVINSGVGFEALLHKKRVFTAGECDYKYITEIINDNSQVAAKMKTLGKPIDEESIIKYMYYLINEVYVDTSSYDSIRKKVERIIRMNGK